MPCHQIKTRKELLEKSVKLENDESPGILPPWVERKPPVQEPEKMKILFWNPGGTTMNNYNFSAANEKKIFLISK